MPRQPEPEKFPAFIAALKLRMKDRAGLVESRYFRWILGDVPDALHFIVENREEAIALLRDALDYADATAKASEGKPEEK